MLAITDAKILIGDSSQSPGPGREVVPVDLNKGAGGDYLWLVTYRDPQKQSAGLWVTEISIIQFDANWPNKDPNITVGTINLNNGTDDGKDIRLTVERKKTGLPVLEVKLVPGWHGEGLDSSWTWTSNNINEGVTRKGHAELYLASRKGTPSS